MPWFHRRPAQSPTRTFGPLNDLLALTPGEFEEEVARLLERQGYRDVRRVSGSDDLDVDIFCLDEAGSRVAVQCKRYMPDNPIHSPAIEVFFENIIQHGAQRGLYVTTSEFTDSAQIFAAQRDIYLIDGSELVKQIISPALIGRGNRGRKFSGARWTCPYCLSKMKSTERRCSGCLRYG